MIYCHTERKTVLSFEYRVKIWYSSFQLLQKYAETKRIASDREGS